MERARFSGNFERPLTHDQELLMLISAASQRSDPSRMCRLIVSSASAILESSDREDQGARMVYVATILRLLEMFRYSTLQPHYHPGGVLSRRPLYQPGLKSGQRGNTGERLEKAFTSALTEVFGNDEREQSIDKLAAYFQARSPEPKAPVEDEPKATSEQAQRFLTKLANEIPA